MDSNGFIHISYVSLNVYFSCFSNKTHTIMYPICTINMYIIIFSNWWLILKLDISYICSLLHVLKRRNLNTETVPFPVIRKHLFKYLFRYTLYRVFCTTWFPHLYFIKETYDDDFKIRYVCYHRGKIPQKQDKFSILNKPT